MTITSQSAVSPSTATTGATIVVHDAVSDDKTERSIVHHPATVFTVSYGLVWTVTKPLNQRVVAAVSHAAQKVLDADDARPLVNSKKMRIS
jgi:hypothetical protein